MMMEQELNDKFMNCGQDNMAKKNRFKEEGKDMLCYPQIT